VNWRLSPRADPKGPLAALPHVFIDSPEAARLLRAQGIDTVALPPPSR